MHKRMEAIVSGKVQMVMFRDFVQRKASALKLVGEVQNLPDGTVRVLAEGEHSHLMLLLKKLHKGSLLAHVSGISLLWARPQKQHTSFSIQYGK